MTPRLALAALALALCPLANADSAAREIEYLIASVAASGCTFERNGQRHDADAAAAHLRRKYRRAARYARTAEQFIDRLASRSSMSGKPYTMTCAGGRVSTSGEWLSARLAQLRRAQP